RRRGRNGKDAKSLFQVTASSFRPYPSAPQFRIRTIELVSPPFHSETKFETICRRSILVTGGEQSAPSYLPLYRFDNLNASLFHLFRLFRLFHPFRLFHLFRLDA